MIIYKSHPQVRLQVKLMYMQYVCVNPQKKRETHTHVYTTTSLHTYFKHLAYHHPPHPQSTHELREHFLNVLQQDSKHQHQAEAVRILP